MKNQPADTRQRIQEAYSQSGEEYDRVRLIDERGRLLSEHDLKLFKSMLPTGLQDNKVVEIGAGTGRFTLTSLSRGSH